MESNVTTININMENLDTEERERLLALVEKANKPKDTGLWKPEKDEEYWYLIKDGGVRVTTNDNYEVDKATIALGNYFQTCEEAEFEVERRKVIQQLRELSGGYKPKRGETWYVLSYNMRAQYVYVDGRYDTTVHGVPVYFKNEVTVNEAVKTVGEDRLKKYYFGIEE